MKLEDSHSTFFFTVSEIYFLDYLKHVRVLSKLFGIHSDIVTALYDHHILLNDDLINTHQLLDLWFFETLLPILFLVERIPCFTRVFIDYDDFPVELNVNVTVKVIEFSG